MKAFVLAAGKGTRLRPFTDDIPKPLVPVLNRPVMARVLDLCRTHGFDEVVANLHYKGEKISRHFEDGSQYGVRLDYSWEKELMGTAGGVRRQAEFLGDGTFLVISGDVVTDLDITRLVHFHKAHGAIATMAVKEVGDPSRFGIVVTDAAGQIQSFQEKPAAGTERSNLANTGIYVFEPEVFDWIPEGQFYDFGKDLFPALVEKGAPVFAMGTGDYWSDVGTLGQYLYTHWDLLCHPHLKQRIGKGTVIEPGAILSSHALIGENCHIERGAVVMGYSCIGDGCVVRSGATVFDSIVWAAEQISLTVADELVRSIYGDDKQVALGVPTL
ncbi:sugar phosphate nucleotidyltransferase [Gloeobacter violaceus]|uniref:Mannose-1-phosphate guanyltransferase n=1 Tax=Gloeobacter violaceus (strain ATCC 29082 / PCC 7421) TaxID=251221 RepID=Q7NC95_GLOVI|nr:NDP-sugar synthase [Gloeobacter violaceus]BAC91025.1 mannose-1-phosphate guanyltransferase [Gloeobacter violaceus PCC 7421]